MIAEESTNAPRSELLLDEFVEPPAWQDQDTARSSAPKSVFVRGLDYEWFTALLYLICDVTCWVLLYGLVGLIRRDEFFVTPFEFVLVDCIAVAVIVQALFIIGGYSRNTETRGLTYTAEHILAIASAAVISSLLIYSAAAYDVSMKPSRGVLLISFVLFLPLSLTYRRFLRRGIAASTAQRIFLVIGSGPLATRFYETYRQSTNQQQLEFVDNAPNRIGKRIAGEGSPIIAGDIALKLGRLDNRYSGVILAESVERLGQKLIERLVRTQFQKTRVYTLESFYEAYWRHVPMHTIDPFWPLQMGFQLARISPYHYLKRLCDIVASAVLLIISLPLMAVTWVVIRLTSVGPAMFKQARIGREGHPFPAYKFRTMKVAESDDDDDIYTRENDSRVTAAGRWLRKLRIDELPQLWNVFQGDMSLIGPRAEWIKCVERYEKRIPFYHFRHLVKPGITGWAQVNYPYGESEEDAIAKLQYDLYYIRHYSLKLDAMIMLKTVHTMLFGKGR